LDREFTFRDCRLRLSRPRGGRTVGPIDPFDFAQGRLSIARGLLLFRELCPAISVEKGVRQSRQPMAYKYFRKTRKFTIAAAGTGLLKLIYV